MSVREIDIQAEIWLFGSRARGNAHEDSDWNFLVLTEHSVNRAFKYRMWDHLNDLELLAERVMSTRVQNKIDWEDVEVTDLYQNIKDDGRRL